MLWECGTIPGSSRRAERWDPHLWGYGYPLPRADTCYFPVLHSTLGLCFPLQLKLSSSHRSLQHQHCFLGTALSAAPPTVRPLHTGLSAAGAILQLLSALLLPRGQIWARAKHQLTHNLLPQTFHGTGKLWILSASAFLQHTYKLLIWLTGNEEL